MIVDDPGVLAEVTDAFRRYEAALLGNDLRTLDAFFWKSPLALRYGVGERLYGYEAIAAFRQARPGGSPQRTLGKTVIVTFGTDFATANTEFHRVGESRVGRQSQSWARLDGEWKVVSAHVSLEAETS
ncbi:MAG TPA: oxalurate catabolism protein HpxZ [Alphaproteobacteria bacterium]|jgi:hypothetical protein|nr:oxalurate catabolism protein HpxZ [Alphaproteobacteria bacterium]